MDGNADLSQELTTAKHQLQKSQIELAKVTAERDALRDKVRDFVDHEFTSFHISLLLISQP
jgi:hypothetical protein